MSQVVIKLNSAGIRQLLKSPEMAAELERRAQAIADAAGDGHRVEVSETPTRARAVVITDSTEARIAEAKDRTLTRAIDAGRG